MRGSASSHWTISIRRGLILLWRPAIACASIVCLLGFSFTLAGPPQISKVVEASDTRVRIFDPEAAADTKASQTVWITSDRIALSVGPEKAVQEEVATSEAAPAPVVASLVIRDVSPSEPRPAPRQGARRASFERKFANQMPAIPRANPTSALPRSLVDTPKPIVGTAIPLVSLRPVREAFSQESLQDSPASSFVSRRLTAKPSLPDLAADLTSSPATSEARRPRQPEAGRLSTELAAFDRVLRERPMPTWQPFARTSDVFPPTLSPKTEPLASDYRQVADGDASRHGDLPGPRPMGNEVRLVTLQTAASQGPRPSPPPASVEPEAPAELEPAASAVLAPVQPLPSRSVRAVEPAAPRAPVRPAFVQSSNRAGVSAPVDPPTRLGPFEVIDHTDELTVISRRSKLLRTTVDVYRTAVVDPSVCDVTQFTPREISVIGKGLGATHVTFWFQDESYRPITYLVRVVADPEVEERREEEYGLLEEHLAELFPNSKVHLLVVTDKLIVKGQARDAAEAAQILAIIRGQYITGSVVSGQAANVAVGQDASRSLPAPQVINMLRIPGVQQVALRVKIAELSRSAARNFGVETDLSFHQGELVLNALVSLATGTPSILGSFDGGDLEFGIHYLEEHGVIRMVSEPTLVCLSGKSATFVSGGEFAVPTTVGVAGASAVTTDFRAFGAIVTFRPVVLDKDHIRLEVAPEFSKINDENTVGGIPGLDTRAVTTTVEMREGQTLAIAGLLDDSMKGDLESNLPFVAKLLGKRGITRNETELIVLVTPELVHPMEPEEVPPLPGFDVTEPTNLEFYLHGHLEGTPTVDYRSTVWPHLQQRFNAGGPAMISGPFGHGD